MALKWWEKTVEYFFIRRCIGHRMLLAPLDGAEEAAGDALLGAERGWVLIEFKKDAQSISSERKKFRNFEEAKEELCGSDSHHIVVYGSLRGEGADTFAVGGRTYFSSESVASIDDLLARGANHADFLHYLAKLLEHKKAAEGVSGGGVSLESYSLVAGINADGSVSQCMSVAEFVDRFMPSQAPSLSSAPDYGSPSL